MVLTRTGPVSLEPLSDTQVPVVLVVVPPAPPFEAVAGAPPAEAVVVMPPVVVVPVTPPIEEFPTVPPLDEAIVAPPSVSVPPEVWLAVLLWVAGALVPGAPPVPPNPVVPVPFGVPLGSGSEQPTQNNAALRAHMKVSIALALIIIRLCRGVAIIAPAMLDAEQGKNQLK